MENNKEPIEMFQTFENLRALVSGIDLNHYQRGLASQEFHKLTEIFRLSLNKTDHAQLAVEDKKELLEALKRLHESLNTYGAHPIIDAQVNKVIKKHETI